MRKVMIVEIIIFEVFGEKIIVGINCN